MGALIPPEGSAVVSMSPQTRRHLSGDSVFCVTGGAKDGPSGWWSLAFPSFHLRDGRARCDRLVPVSDDHWRMQ
jgi:hypothetical protein